MKKDRELTRLFREELPVEEQGRKRAMEAIRKSIRSKKPVCVPAWRQIFYTQLPFFSRGYWCFQVFLLLLGASAIAGAGELSVWIQDGPLFSRRVLEPLAAQGGVPCAVLLPVLSAIMALVSVAGFAELGKCFSCRMWELEYSCCLDLKQLLAVRMAITGMVDLIWIACFTAASLGRLQTGFVQTGIYLLTPYVCNSLLYLTVFTFARGSGRILQACVLAAACCISFLPACIPYLYEQAALWLWLVVLAAAGSLAAAELFCLAGKIGRGEEICWN